jgi:hypothetical protein
MTPRPFNAETAKIAESLVTWDFCALGVLRVEGRRGTDSGDTFH